MGNAIQLAPEHEDIIPFVLSYNAQDDCSTPCPEPSSSCQASTAALSNIPSTPASVTVLWNTAGGLASDIYHQGAVNSISTNNHQVALQEGHPRPEWLVASASEARYIMHRSDMPGGEARRSQDIRARGGNGALQIVQPSKDLNSIATDIKKVPGPSKSRHAEVTGPLSTSPAHPVKQNTHVPRVCDHRR